MPPANGVSAGSRWRQPGGYVKRLYDLPGPTMTAFHSMMFSGLGNAEIPSGTSVLRRLRSLTSRRRATVDLVGNGW